MLDFLLQAGADIDHTSRVCSTLLHRPLCQSLTLLRAAYATCCLCCTQDGETALHRLCGLPSSESTLTLVRTVLDRRASTNVRDRSGATPLFRAAKRLDTALVRLLVARGANTLLQDQVLDCACCFVVCGRAVMLGAVVCSCYVPCTKWCRARAQQPLRFSQFWPEKWW